MAHGRHGMGLMMTMVTLMTMVTISLILKKMVLSTSSENFKMWEGPPINPHLKVLKHCQKTSLKNFAACMAFR